MYDDSAEYGIFQSKIVAYVVTFIGLYCIWYGFKQINDNKKLQTVDAVILSKQCLVKQSEQTCLYKVIYDNKQFQFESKSDKYEEKKIEKVIFDSTTKKIIDFEQEYDFNKGWVLIGLSLFIIICSWFYVYVNLKYKFAASASAFSFLFR
jgi:hypothetical protein